MHFSSERSRCCIDRGFGAADSTDGTAAVTKQGGATGAPFSRKVLIFSAPSGSGKTTIVRELMVRFPRLEFSVSATSRAPRGVEVNGRDYHFVSPDEFRKLIDRQSFVEWEEVYDGCYYGTLRSEVEGIWERENVCVFDVDVEGGVRLKEIFGDAAMSFFIEAPEKEARRAWDGHRGEHRAAPGQGRARDDACAEIRSCDRERRSGARCWRGRGACGAVYRVTFLF